MPGPASGLYAVRDREEDFAWQAKKNVTATLRN